MQHLEGLLWSLVFLIVAAAALTRISGWRGLEALATRAAIAVVLVLFCLPLVHHEATTVRNGIASRTPSFEVPEVVVITPEHLAGVGLVVVGHVALGLWLLRRRARGETTRRLDQQREADRRRERGRLPPQDVQGGAS